MKTYCKPSKANIEDINLIRRAVYKAFDGKLHRRRDFQRLLLTTGAITRRELRSDLEMGSRNHINRALDVLAEDFQRDIQDRHLRCTPLRPFQRRDPCSGKLRDLCREGAYQQVCEYIAVEALMPLFRARLLPCQFGSIPGRGQVQGARRIRRILRRYPGSLWAIKSDVHKAYPSTRVAMVLGLLRRDIRKNEPLLWFLAAVMDNYPNGTLVIGGYLSTWLFNYVMSYVIREMMASGRLRRGRFVRDVWAVTNYADDTAIFGTRSGLIRAMRKAKRWAEAAGLDIKPGWLMLDIPPLEAERENHRQRRAGSRKRTAGVDMMGFVVRRRCIIIRGRVWRKLRRQLLRAWVELSRWGRLPWWRSRRLSSYKGWILHTNSQSVEQRYHTNKIWRAARDAVSRRERMMYYAHYLHTAA